MTELILAFVLCITLLVAVILVRLSRENMKEYDVRWVGFATYDERAKKLTFKGGKTGKFHVFYGNCTVWYDKYGKRCGTMLEYQLHEIWNYCTHRKI